MQALQLQWSPGSLPLSFTAASRDFSSSSTISCQCMSSMDSGVGGGSGNLSCFSTGNFSHHSRPFSSTGICGLDTDCCHLLSRTHDETEWKPRQSQTRMCSADITLLSYCCSPYRDPNILVLKKCSVRCACGHALQDACLQQVQALCAEARETAATP